jgi:RNA polymerase sigma-70 factor (ECF subfamily)
MDAKDISQEVFIEVYQSISSFRQNSALSTWIYRIAVTKSLDEIRKRKRKKRIMDVGKMLHLDEIADWIAGGAKPESGLNESESIREVTEVLNRLPENQRIAFTLSKIEGFTNKEIAAIMDTTIIAVESLMSHAKKRVSAELMRIVKK